ncbi:hypothetical protein BU15DRAFT_67502 [Melanogaster broomeanus]|nr:hypothetical protein BU15DRAFT_67502 [Melanogaster broomeanus]
MQRLQEKTESNFRKDIANAQDRYDQQLLQQEQIQVEIKSIRWYDFKKKLKLSLQKSAYEEESRMLYELTQFNLTESFELAEPESCTAVKNPSDFSSIRYGSAFKIASNISPDEAVTGVVIDADSMTENDIVSLVQTIYENLDSPDNPFRDPVDAVRSMAESSEGGLIVPSYHAQTSLM